MASSNNNETVHISLGNTANYITSHLLNLQGLAATSSSSQNNESGSGGGGAGACGDSAALCDPSVTHDVSPLDSDYYSAGSSSSASSRYMYTPRALIVDGRDSFGSSWGGVNSNNSNHGGGVSAQNYHQTSPTSSSYSPNIPSINDPNSSVSASTWNGAVKVFDASEHNKLLLGDQDARQPPRHSNTQQNQQLNESAQYDNNDALHRFQNAASIMGLSPIHSRFNAAPPPTSSYNIGVGGDSSRHVQWDEEGEEEGEDEDDEYCYGGQNEEQIQEEKRRQLERMEYKHAEMRREWGRGMEDAFEEAFYGSSTSSSTVGDVRSSLNSNSGGAGRNDNSNAIANAADGNAASDAAVTREIQWYDYWMPPKPCPTKYQVPLPFDTSCAQSNNTPSNVSNTAWSTSFNMGYHPSSSGGGSGTLSSGMGGNDSMGITRSWRENVLSESLRKILENSDVVKGFNIFVDGGNHTICGAPPEIAPRVHTGSSGSGANEHAKKLSEIITAGGGFHAGLATSLLEELSEECRSAGRWVVLVDPLNNHHGNASEDANGNNNTEFNQVHYFRQCLNAGLALHGLSENSHAFLPVSIDGAYRALRGDSTNYHQNASQNRRLFEASAAISLALEASTLFYRLHRNLSSSHSSGGPSRSRIGIQSGFYQGYTGGSGSAGQDGFDNEPYATAPALTYHEFLACARPSSDRRRSILELDALLCPISFPSTGDGLGSGLSASGGINAASLLAGNATAGDAGGMSASVLASLASAGIIGGGFGSNNTLGELQKRLEKGTSIERMRMEQRQQGYRSSRSGRPSSSRSSEPGEWLEDYPTNNGGLLSSLSSNSSPFGQREDHHHFALSASLRPASSEVCSVSSVSSNPGGGCGAVSAHLRPMMEGMGVKYRPEVNVGAVVKDTVVDLTGVGSYWRSIFTDRSTTSSSASPASTSGGSGSGSSSSSNNNTISNQQRQKPNLSPRDIASHTPILSVLGNSTRSYPRLSTISTGFVDAIHSRRNMGYMSRDVMAGIAPERDDCEEALEYCREVVDVYEPPLGSGLVDGEDENDDLDAYFDED